MIYRYIAQRRVVSRKSYSWFVEVSGLVAERYWIEGVRCIAADVTDHAQSPLTLLEEIFGDKFGDIGA